MARRWHIEDCVHHVVWYSLCNVFPLNLVLVKMLCATIHRILKSKSIACWINTSTEKNCFDNSLFSIKCMYFIYFPSSILSMGGGNDNPLQFSCLEYPMDGGAWQATVHGVAKSRTRLSDFTHSLHIHYGTISTPRSWWTVHRACSDFSSYIWTHLCMLCVCVSVCVLCNFITL